MQTGVEDRQVVPERVQRTRHRHRSALVVAVILGCLGIAAIILAHNWPFTREAITRSLEQQSGSTVQIGHFHKMYFPQPGSVAEEVIFRRSSGQSQPLMVIHKLTVVGSYPGLLTHHISKIRADGIHMTIAPEQPQNGNLAPINVGSLQSGLTIGKIVADGAEVEFPAADKRGQSLIFRIPKLVVHDLADNRPLSYHATVQLPLPPAEVELAGKFGPWRAGQGGQSQMTGSYVLKSLDLSAFSGIAGNVTSKGSFDGILQHVKLHGFVDTRNFTVRRSGHPVHLAADYDATVNGLNGDVAIDAARVHLGRTTINAVGSVAGGDNDAGKTATFKMSSNRARIQDLVWLFVSDDKPPMTGPIIFRAQATLPPDQRPFLDKLKLAGDFGIVNAQYPNPETQKNVDVLSARARGEADKVEDQDDKRGNDSYDPGRVVSNVKGHVVLRNAIARLSDIHFDVPGASAQVSGTYKLRTEQIDLRGQLWLDTKLSKATTGVKSFLLKIIQPLTEAKKHKGSLVSLQIGGTYKNPTYTVLPVAKK